MKSAKEVKLKREVLAALPIFPLPNVVLFPGALLPLHIFEPRYRDMTRDALESHRMLAMAMRLEAEVDGHLPAVALVVGVGEIVAAEPMPDGRYNLLLEGRARARIVKELPKEKSYRRVQAVQLFDDGSAEGEAGSPEHTAAQARLGESEAALRALIEEVAGRLEDDDALALRQAVGQPLPLSRLTDRLASVLVTKAETRQALLETLNLGQRVDRLSREVAGLLVHLRSKSALN